MDKEIREYSLQLQAVQDSLSTDPGNEELKALEDELKDLIDLISSQKKEPAAENEQGNQAKYAVGQKVVANWVSGDGRFYPARITSIAGAANQPMFTVTFLHYANTETLGLSGVREMNDTMAQDQSTTNQGKSQTERKSSSARVQPTSEPTKPIPHRQNDKPEPKVGEVQAVQSKWQKFAQKGVKRGRVGKAHTVGEHSMFKSPDHFSGRVGFVGSGQGLRKQDSVRGKHSFEKWQGDVEDT